MASPSSSSSASTNLKRSEELSHLLAVLSLREELIIITILREVRQICHIFNVSNKIQHNSHHRRSFVVVVVAVVVVAIVVVAVVVVAIISLRVGWFVRLLIGWRFVV